MLWESPTVRGAVNKLNKIYPGIIIKVHSEAAFGISRPPWREAWLAAGLGTSVASMLENRDPVLEPREAPDA